MRRFYFTGAIVVLMAMVTLGFTLSAYATSWNHSFAVDESAKNPDVAIDSNGGMHFVWIHAQHARPQYRFCANANTCDAVEKLPGVKGKATAVALALDSLNRPNVVWEERQGDRSAIYYSRRDEAGWSKPDKVSKDLVARLPDIAIGTDDVKHIVFESIANDSRTVYHGTRGGGSDTLQLVESESGAAPDRVTAGRNVRVEVDSKGRAHLVWNTATNPPRVKYAYQRGDGNFVVPLLISDQNRPQWPDLAIDRETNRVGIIWETRADELASFAVYKNGEPLFRRSNITGGYDSVRRPRLAADCGGRFHVVFQRQRLIQTDWNIYHRVFNPEDEMFSTTERITQADTDDAGPVIAAAKTIAIGYNVADNTSVRALRGEIDSVCYGEPTPVPTAFPTQPPTGEWEHIPNHDARIIYKKGWQTFDANKASEANYARCQAGGACKKNSSAELVFTGGTRVEWVTAYASNYGRADVYIDGEAFEVVDLCGPNRDSEKPKFGVRTYILDGDENTEHSIKIVAVGHTGCSGVNKNFVAVDGFNILR